MSTRVVFLLMIVFAMSGGDVLAQASPPQAPAMDQQWPDAYRSHSAGVVLPRVVREQKPRYTADAMRAGIRGTVLVECVVETDGTVQRVRIARSLDARFGLDQAAIEATKEWRFEPGTKDGVPVPVLVTIELTFTLRDTPRDIAPLTLPEAFSAAPPGEPNGEPAWQQTEIDASPLTVSVSHQASWVVVRGLPNIPFTVQHPSGSFVAMMAPMPTTAVLEPGTRADLEAAAKTVASGYKRPVVATGQAQVAGRLWIWFDMGIEDVPTSPGGTHLWLFSSPIEGQQVILAFSVFHPRSTQQQDWDAQAGPAFSTILERMSFTRAQ